MQKIDGSPKSLKQLLQNTKYTIHYYQREYMWQRKNIEELVGGHVMADVNAFLIYQDDNGVSNVNVCFGGEDVWLAGVI